MFDAWPASPMMLSTEVMGRINAAATQPYFLGSVGLRWSSAPARECHCPMQVLLCLRVPCPGPPGSSAPVRVSESARRAPPPCCQAPALAYSRLRSFVSPTPKPLPPRILPPSSNDSPLQTHSSISAIPLYHTHTQRQSKQLGSKDRLLRFTFSPTRKTSSVCELLCLYERLLFLAIPLPTIRPLRICLVPPNEPLRSASSLVPH